MSTPSTPRSRQVALINGSFEEPNIAPDRLRFCPDAEQTHLPGRVPGWLTTAPDRMIEIWRYPSQGVTPAVGEQFVELNANYVSTLYQDLDTTPGTTLYWSLYHRGRQGFDTMALDIGVPGRPVEQALMTDGNAAWGRYNGTYTVPEEQTTTRFSFRSVRSTGGSTVGNFLDGISFGTVPFLTLTKTAAEETVEAGHPIIYQVQVKNEGGSEAENVVLTDSIPPYTTYVPGSLRIVDGPHAGPMSDDPDDGDQAHYDYAANKVVFRLGNGASGTQGGSLPNTDTLPDGTTVEFQVMADIDAGGRETVNQASAVYENRLGAEPEELTSWSDPVSTSITKPPLEGEYTKLACYPHHWPNRGHICNYRFTVTAHQARVERWEIFFRLDEEDKLASLYANVGETLWYESIDPDEQDFVTVTDSSRAGRIEFTISPEQNGFRLRSKPGHNIEPGQPIPVDVRLLHPTKEQADNTRLVGIRVSEYTS
ncbi:hypothetical protein [Streptomyces lavendulae]|uniref:hypothetical protein n=1 Tax=Streptomyces lavendulae TaxID=1914 RepID=UPI0036EBDB57